MLDHGQADVGAFGHFYFFPSQPYEDQTGLQRRSQDALKRRDGRLDQLENGQYPSWFCSFACVRRTVGRCDCQRDRQVRREKTGEAVAFSPFKDDLHSPTQLLLPRRSTKPTRSLSQGETTDQGRTSRGNRGHCSRLQSPTQQASMEGAGVRTLTLRSAVTLLTSFFQNS